jgi:hypothetical protein
VLGTPGIAAHTQERVIEQAVHQVVLDPVLDLLSKGHSLRRQR